MTGNAPGEFELIQRYFCDAFRAQAEQAAGVRLGIGDDCAILGVGAGEELLVSVDTLNSDVHFPADADPRQLARRALAVSVSDLAAMGATPLGFTLALGAAQLSREFLQAFSGGLVEAATEFAIPLVGGDTTRAAALSLSIQVMGVAPTAQAIRRSGASPGDMVWVSGTLGDGRAALDCLTAVGPDVDQQLFLQRYWSPPPRLALGVALRGLATAAIDISDGLAADLGHILAASHRGARIELAALPLSRALRGRYAVAVAREYALAGGDDYELCFTAPRAAQPRLQALADRLQLPLTPIGEITAAPGLQCVDERGETVAVAAGYQHF